MTVHRPDHLPAPEADETYVREVIDSAMAGTRPPLDLPGLALARGRRLRTRRRIGVAGAVVAASVLAAVAVPWALGGDGSRASDSSRMLATEPPAPQPEHHPGWWDMPSADMITALEDVLPDSVVVTAPGPLEADTPEGGPATGWVNAHLDAPSGPGRLNVMLYRDPYAFTIATEDPMPTSGGATGGSDGLTGDEALDYVRSRADAAADGEPDRTSCDEVFEGRVRCVQIRDEDGTVVGRRLTHTWSGVVTNEVVLRRGDGIVYAASANTLDEKWGAGSPVSATRPPLTLDQLEALVRDDVWVSYEP